MLSLKKQLNNYIRLKGEVDYSDIKQKVESGYFGKYYRMTTAERRLRNESPEVEAVYENGYIVKYVWKGEPLTTLKFIQDPNDKSKVICEKIILTPSN